MKTVFLTSLLLFASVTVWGADQPSGPEMASRFTTVMTAPPTRMPTAQVVDGPILGNGDLGVALAGPPEAQLFYLGKNDFWNQQQVPMTVGGIQLLVPQLSGGSYRQEQDIANAEVRGTFAKGGLTLHTRSWVSANENLLVTELSSEGGPILGAAKLWPEPTRLQDNDNPVQIGREQHGDGRWYFTGLIDEVLVYDRALTAKEIGRLVQMDETKQGLVRRWSFDEDEGTTPQDTVETPVVTPACPQPPTTQYRMSQSPAPYETRCRHEGHNLQQQRYSHGKTGRAAAFVNEWMYINAGKVPPLRTLTVSAWIYIYTAGDANYILSKGDWNDAYSLSLDHGRLRFNIGEWFVRSEKPLPARQWVHVAGTFDGTQLRAYVDGEEVLPEARLLYGGASGDVLSVTRSADGLLDEFVEYPPQPIPPSSIQGMKGREVTLATRLVGAPATVENGALRFSLRPGDKVELVTSVLSDVDAPEYTTGASARVTGLTLAELNRLNGRHREWWRAFWSQSFVDIGDPLLEKYYYTSHYIMASASRTGKVAPGLYGPWITTDFSGWNGDYTLNYNYETPYLALYSSNHIATTDAYDAPILDFMGRGKLYARTLLNVRGVYYPGHIGPWGMERIMNYDPFMGQKEDTAYVAVPMVMRFYYTYDLAYAQKVYPYLREVANFWEDYLKFENGQYVIHRDCGNAELGPWLRGPNWRACGERSNPTDTLTYIRVVLKALIEISRQLGVDADRDAKWQHILDHLYPVGGGRVTIWPAGLVGLDSDPKMLEAERARVRAFNNHPLFAPSLPRIGYDPGFILDNLRRYCQNNAYPNSYIYFPGGGIETASTVPGTINEMLLESHQGVLRPFPDWPKDKDGRFGNLRAYGAFLVSSEFVKGQVRSLTIESEKGRECSLENPWPGKPITLYRSGKKAERLTGDRVTFKTSAGERIEVRPR